jgi:hypothetical protein
MKEKMPNWDDNDKKYLVDTATKWSKNFRIGKISRVLFIVKGQLGLPLHKQYTEAKIKANLPLFWNPLLPWIVDDTRSWIWGGGGELKTQEKPKSTHGEPQESLPLDEEALYAKLHDRLFSALIDDIREEVRRAVTDALAPYIPKDNFRSPPELRRMAIEQSAHPVTLKKPRVSIFGLPDTQHESPKLEPFKKVLDLRLHDGARTSDPKHMAENSDIVLVMSSHIPTDIYKWVKEGGKNKIIPVHGGTSALEAALHVVCVSNKVFITPSTKAHQ